MVKGFGFPGKTSISIDDLRNDVLDYIRGVIATGTIYYRECQFMDAEEIRLIKIDNLGGFENGNRHAQLPDTNSDQS